VVKSQQLQLLPHQFLAAALVAKLPLHLLLIADAIQLLLQSLTVDATLLQQLPAATAVAIAVKLFVR
jgi:hypothetical protein